MDFLKSTTKALWKNAKQNADGTYDLNLKDGTYISAKGKNVMVIGGGDTGNDCVGTSMRHGAKSVLQLEMMPKAPDERTEMNPWPEWPRVCKTDYGQQEAAAVFGHDPRVYQTTVKEFKKDKNGKVCKAVLVKLEPKKNEKTGRMMMTEVAGSEYTVEQKTKRMEMEEKTASKRRKTLERELEWVRMAPKARQAKGKARLNSYDKLLNEDVKEKEEKLEIFIPNGPRLGNKVIEAKHVAKAYGDKLLFDDLNFMLPPNGIVGVIGPNGAGKTTLFRLIMGLETVDKGEFEVGETVKVAYVDQQHRDIDPNKSVYQVISGGNELIRMGGRDVNARAYLSRFNFSGGDQEKLCGVLSGGERNRLHLAMALKEEGNVLLLDEPTNDIDVNTLRALEEGLEDFAGCAVVISHDRWFLDRICTHILAFEGDSNVFYFEGSYSEYEENKMKRLGNEEPKRVRYRKLMTD